MEHVIKALWTTFQGTEGIELKVLPHQGFKDLEKSAPRKLAAWANSNARFLILRDNDNADCVERKARLLNLVSRYPAASRCKIRIVCQELEAWFLGDLNALRRSGLMATTFNAGQTTVPYRDPDGISEPVAKLDRCTKRDVEVARQKRTVAASIAPHLNPDDNASESFRQTVAALRGFIEELAV